ELARRVKIEMARPRARLGRGEPVRNEFSVLRVDAIDHYFVQAEVGRERVYARRIEHNAVRVRPILPFGIRAFTLVLRNVARFPDPARGLNRVEHDGPAPVIGGKDEFAGRMHRHVAGDAWRMLFVELPQIARLLIDREGGDAAPLLACEYVALVGGVQK